MYVVPRLKHFKRFVNGIDDKRDRLLIQILYLLAARASEVCTKTIKYDLEHKKTRPFGQHLSYEIDEHEGEKALVVTSGVLKRKSKRKKNVERLVTKAIGLPVNPKFEPWTIPILKHLEKTDRLSFDLTRHSVWRIVKSRLVPLDDSVTTHSLRHYRLTHLRQEYGFDAMELTIYAGWTFKTGVQSSGQLDTYLHLDWRGYFPKLLKART